MIIKRKNYSNISISESRYGYPKDNNGNELPRPGWTINNPKKLRIKYNLIFKDSYNKDRSRVLTIKERRIE